MEPTNEWGSSQLEPLPKTRYPQTQSWKSQLKLAVGDRQKLGRQLWTNISIQWQMNGRALVIGHGSPYFKVIWVSGQPSSSVISFFWRAFLMSWTVEYSSTYRRCVSPWPSCLRRWLGSLLYVRTRDPSSKPSQGAHWHGPTQPTTRAEV